MKRPVLVLAAVVAAGAVGLVLVRLTSRGSAAAPAGATPTVAVAPVVRRDLDQILTVQAEFRAYQEIEIHPKVAGYLRQIAVDFGDQVKAGDLIARIEVPELEDDLHRAAAAEQRALADYGDAHLDYTRMLEVNRTRPNLLAQQDIDAAAARDAMTAANAAAAKAEREKYQTLEAYTTITAPFEGVVTQRYADPGALIQAGTASNTQSQPLIRLSENDRLRLDFPISEAYAEQIALGDTVDIRCGNPERRFTGRIARFTRRIALDTRTMETEVELPNPGLKLIPGEYATVALRINRRPGALAVPVEAVKGGDHPTVWVVSRDARIEERPVRIGIATPTAYEVLGGLSEGDEVVIGDRSGAQPGQVVTTRPADMTTGS